MVDVHKYFDAFDSTSAKTRAVGSSIRLAQPVMNGVNNLLGYTMQGNLAWVSSDGTPTDDTSMERSFYANRHPNCDALHCLIHTGVGAGQEGDPATIAVQAGSGSPHERDVPPTGGWVELFPAWGSSDSGPCEITITGDGVGFDAACISELIRISLSGGSDTCLVPVDSSYPAAGLYERRRIIESSSSGPKGMIEQTYAAWKYGTRQGLAWWSLDTSLSVDAAVYTNPFSSEVDFSFRTRLKRSSETTRDYRAYLHTWCDATVTSYSWRVSSDTDSVTSTGLTHTSGAWTGSPQTGLAVSADADDTIVIELKRDGGTGYVYVQRVAIVPEVV